MYARSSLNKASLSFHKLEMKTTMLIFLISVVCLFSSVQSRVVNEASTEYSPVHMAPQDGLKDGPHGLRQTQVSLPQHSEYVTVDPSAGRALFFWFAEADESSTQPLMLWLSRGSSNSDFAYTKTTNSPSKHTNV